jgi:hypothetical protein
MTTGRHVLTLLVLASLIATIPWIPQNKGRWERERVLVLGVLKRVPVREREMSRSCKRVLVPVYIGDVRNFIRRREELHKMT